VTRCIWQAVADLGRVGGLPSATGMALTLVLLQQPQHRLLSGQSCLLHWHVTLLLQRAQQQQQMLSMDGSGGAAAAAHAAMQSSSSSSRLHHR